MAEENASEQPNMELPEEGNADGDGVASESDPADATDAEASPQQDTDIDEIAAPATGTFGQIVEVDASGVRGAEVVDPRKEPEPEPTELELMTEERDRLKDRLLRTAADYENFRKRMRREIEDTQHRAKEDALREILPIIDNLERAADAAESAQDVTAVADGVKMVLRGFHDVATRLGLTRVQTKGLQFDPTVHDAIQQHATNEHPPGTILEEAVPGYQLGNRLLRAAMVIVARPPLEGEEQAARAASEIPLEDDPMGEDDPRGEYDDTEEQDESDEPMEEEPVQGA